MTPNKHLPSPPFLFLSLLIGGLAFYGVQAWYFPNARSWFLAVPAMLVALVVTIWLIPGAMKLYPTKGRKIGALVCMVLFIPMLSGVAAGLGAPALVLRLQGPDTTIIATVRDKDRGTRRCRRKVEFTEYRGSPGRICLSVAEFEALREGGKVELAAREGYFGMLAFSIRPAS